MVLDLIALIFLIASAVVGIHFLRTIPSKVDALPRGKGGGES